MITTYLSVADYLRAPSGHDTSTLVGNVATLSAPISAGATSLAVTPAISVAQNAGDRITIFDGSNTEIVTVGTGGAAIGVTSIAVLPAQYAHTQGTSLCSDGSQGSLADMIINASSQIEAYCRQPLLQTSHSNERLPLRSMRAAITRDYTLRMRPKQFPVQSVSAISIQLNASTTLTLDATQAMIDVDAQMIEVAQISTTAGSVPFWGNVNPPARQTTPGWVQLSYVAGYAYSALPYDIRQAAIWLVSDLLSDRRNPTGAAEVKMGKMQLVTRLRGDTSGRSVLVLRAYEALDPYRQRAM